MTYPRERTRSTKVSKTYVRTVYWPNASTPSQISSIPCGYEGADEFVGDTNSGRFHQTMRTGAIINNPFEKTERRYFANSMVGYRARANAPWTPGGTDYMETDQAGPHLTNMIGNIEPITTLTAGDYDRALAVCTTRALSKIVKPEIASLVSLAEMHQTLSMLRHPLKFLSKMTQVNKSRVKKLKETGSDAYLQYRYGIRPLMNDIEGVINLITKVHRPRYTARAEETVSRQITNNFTTSPSSIRYGYQDKHTHTIQYRVGTLYECEVSLTDAMGFSVRNIPEVAWEVIPYSFVADWFANVGDYLRAIMPVAGCRTLASWTVLRDVISSSRQITSTVFTVPGWTLQRSGSGFDTGQWVRITRSPSIIGPSISFRPDLLRFTTDARLLDSILLVEQNVRRLA